MSETLPEKVAVAPTQFTRSDWMHVLWGFWWRGVCFMIATGVAGFILGIVLGILVGVAMAMLEIPREVYAMPLQVAAFTLGLCVGIALMPYYIRWLLRVRFGSLQLVFLRTAAIASEPGLVHI